MQLLTPGQTVSLQDWFLPERPGPLIGAHVIATGCGSCWVDRWPHPHAVLVESAGNYTLLGDPAALALSDLQPHIKGFVDADESFAPLLHAAFPALKVWPRVVLVQLAPDPNAEREPGVRCLDAGDAEQLALLEPGSAWISKSWGGPVGLAQSGMAWGAFVDGQLAAVACTFFLGKNFEEIGVVTIPEQRRKGLSAACTRALCADIRARGHQPSWTTSPDNRGSLGVAAKLGFQFVRNDVSYVIGMEIPGS